MKFAQLEWEDGAPVNVDFGDIYFSRRGALDEVEQVFLGGNALPQRWSGCRSFAIGETGFGTGLNFFVTAANWLRHAPEGAVLYYFSVEKFPITASDMRRALAQWPSLRPLVDELIAAFEQTCDGYHRRYLYGDRVVLTLAVGEAGSMLSGAAGQVDAWYLDGFAPKRNPEMWTENIFQNVARLSRPGASFSTFTAAGEVRRRLIGAGFAVEKVPGFGGKRERLQGVLAGGDVSAFRESEPWFPHPAPASSGEIAVIGGGISGLTAALALSRRGWPVTVFEAKGRLGCGASAVPAALVAPKLSGSSQSDCFVRHAFRHVVPWLSQLQARYGDLGWRQSGLVDFVATGAAEAILGVDMASAAGGLGGKLVADTEGAATGQGAFIPLGGHVLTAEFFAGILRGFPALEVRLGRQVESLRRDAESWTLLDGESRPLGSFANVVVAQGWTPSPLLAELAQPLAGVRGQVTMLKPNGPWSELKSAVRSAVHVIPVGDGRALVGATYRRDRLDSRLEEIDDQENLRALAVAPLGWSVRGDQVEGGWAGIRLAAPDYAPVAGPLPDVDAYRAVYGDLHHGRSAAAYPPGRYRDGLYVLTALGSRGFVTAPLAAELIADYVCGVPTCVDTRGRQALHPARFLIKQLKRRSNSAGDSKAQNAE